MGHVEQSAAASIPCPEATDSLKDNFQADTSLMNFLTQSSLGLWRKVAGQANDTEQRKNVCNSERLVDITTLYLARALSLSVSNIITNFVFDEGKSYVFPNHTTIGPSQIFPPLALTNFPNLEQTYWTIISQYTQNTEPVMRNRQKQDEWCWIVGKGMFDHCEATIAALTCPTTTPNNYCQDIWKFFVEACHRVHSLDTSVDEYSLNGKDPNYICAPSNPGVKFYELSRL